MITLLFLVLHLHPTAPHVTPPRPTVTAAHVSSPAVRVPAHKVLRPYVRPARPARGSWFAPPAPADTPAPIVDDRDVADIPTLPSPPDTCPAGSLSYLTDTGWGCQTD